MMINTRPIFYSENSDYALVLLSQGKVSFIDIEDTEKVGKYNWCFDPTGGYALRSKHKHEKGSPKIRLHRFINKTPHGFETDHINGDKLDNRKINLRTVTQSQNNQNRFTFKGTSSNYKGVIFHQGKWRSQLTFNKKTIYLGRFDSEIEAAKAYDMEANKLYGQYARLNFNIGG